jgi:TRAP-type C4-dicarboxylate transport system permease small subunit
VILIGEAFVLAFFMVTAWAGWRVFGILGGDTLVSLPWVPQRLTQSVIPIGAVLFIIAEVVTFPEVWAGPAPQDGEAESNGAELNGAEPNGAEPTNDEAAGLEGPS